MDGKRGTTPGMKLPSRKSLQRSRDPDIRSLECNTGWLLSAPRSLPACVLTTLGHPRRCVSVPQYRVQDVADRCKTY
ncbi:hypothetical protein ALC57_12434 [Trachymyrmex cornetzi]|uniref:Uncharacterized protein n=1 Tax=Trachymyrmex cornetzi TaxID=471704 RepID=A0A195DR45_9HYME|nr:hypothetical protein ALC57_12434 [Trachymyrmex cornetzi]